MPKVTIGLFPNGLKFFPVIVIFVNEGSTTTMSICGGCVAAIAAVLTKTHETNIRGNMRLLISSSPRSEIAPYLLAFNSASPFAIANSRCTTSRRASYFIVPL